jgi:Gram-negative bacterial TonB protein C-terminal
VLDARIPVALGISLLLHLAAVALVERLPRGWQSGGGDWGQWSPGALQARLQIADPVETLAPAPKARESRSPRRTTDLPAGVLALPEYLPAEELDERPLIRNAVNPQFPPDAPVSRGIVVLELRINESGAVDEVVAQSAVPPGVFESAARAAFAPALFTPGRKDGVAVKSRVSIELRFGQSPAATAQAPEQGLALFQAPRRARPFRNPSVPEKP